MYLTEMIYIDQMVNAIRQEQGAEPNVLSGVARFWFAFAVLFTFSLVGAAIIYSRLYGMVGGVIIGAIAVVSAAVMFWMFQKGRANDIVYMDDEVSDGIALLVSQSAHACLYMREGRPIRANEDFKELALKIGVKSQGDSPPSVESLFRNSGDDVSATLFRLLHEVPHDVPTEAEVSTLINDKLHTYRLRVSTQPDSQFWEIIDLTNDLTYHSKKLAEAPIGLVSVAADGKVLSINNNLLRWIGVSEADSPAYLREFIDDPDVLLESPKSPGRTVRADTRLVTHKGMLTPVVLQATWQTIDSEDYIAYIAVHGHSSLSSSSQSDVTDTQTGQVATLDTSSDLSGAPIAYIELDNTDLSVAKVTASNAAFGKMFGQGSGQGLPFRSLFRPVTMGIDFSKMDARDRSPDEPFDAILNTKNDVSVSMYLVSDQMRNAAQVYIVDISARKALEDQLVQSQKMQAIGRLVAEIAHDFNNLLAAMRLYTDTLLNRHPIGDPSYPELQQINANVNRAASLVKKLLDYSRKTTVRPVRLDVSETLSDIAVTLKQVLGEKVTLDVVHGRNLPRVRIDPNQLDTVLMNLAVNARDAMKEQGGGKITIQSRKFVKADISDPVLKTALSTIDSDNFVCIAVKDTGTGITDEIKSKIFEPFFTTKGQGEGTGLGLSTVYGIVEQAGGYLAVDSELGVGTTFTLYFPEASKDSESDAAPVVTTAPKKRPPADLAGSGNILFVEDEDSVRIIAAKTLRKRGYQVVEAADGEEAYDILQDTKKPFDLMISDVVMPGMDGPTLLKEARGILGDARIVFISGYAEEEFSELLAEEPDVTFLPKPFTLVQLAEKVKSEIGEVAA